MSSLKNEVQSNRAFWRKRQVFPSDEFETIKLFHILEQRTGWKIVYLSSNKFPDAIIEKNGQQLTAEFEYCAKNFLKHGHDFKGCDLIICWFNDWPDAPLPVWALIDCGNYEAYYFNEVLRANYVPRRTILRAYHEIEDLFRDVREVLDLDVDDPEWGAPNLEQQYEWTLEALYNPPRGLRWALALAHVGLGNFDTHSFAWWLRSISEIREK